MTGQIQDRAYRWQRRYVFAVTLAAVVAILVFLIFLGILS
jgi:hypothetical protein